MVVRKEIHERMSDPLTETVTSICPETAAPVFGKTRALAAARLVVLVSFFDLFMQFPVVPPYARSIGASAAMVGLVVAAYSASNLIGNLVAGFALDRWGRRVPILLGLTVAGTMLGAYAFVRDVGDLLLVRAAHGLAVATLTPGAFAIIGDAAAKSGRARAMGATGAMICVAAVLGPPFSGIVADRFGAKVVFVGMALVMLMAGLVFLILTTGSLRVTLGVEGRTNSASLRDSDSFLNRGLLTAFAAALFLTFGLGIIVTHLPLRLTEAGWGRGAVGASIATFALVAMFVMLSPLSRFSDQRNRVRPIILGFGLLSVALFLLSFSPVAMSVFGGMCVFGLGFGLMFPSATALVTDASPRRRRGAAFGIFYAVYSLGVVIGAASSGLVADHAGDGSGLPLVMGGIVSIIAMGVLPIISRADSRGSHAAAQRRRV